MLLFKENTTYNVRQKEGPLLLFQSFENQLKIAAEHTLRKTNFSV